jgi:hypothetical protein
MSKKVRKEEGAKRNEQKKNMTLIAALSACTIGIAMLVVFAVLPQGKERVFVANGNQAITLRADGTFNARLAHDTVNGTYTENTKNGITTITFALRGVTANGSIADTVLTLPVEWDDGHGHSTKFTLTP